MSIPYYTSLPGSNQLDYGNSWSEPAQSSLKSQQNLGLHYQHHDKDSAVYMQTPVTHASDRFSPTSPLFGNQMLATPTTALDNSDRLSSPELLMRQQFAASSQVMNFPDPAYAASLTASVPNVSSENSLLVVNITPQSQFQITSETVFPQAPQLSTGNSSNGLENKLIHELFPQNMHCIPEPTDFDPQPKASQASSKVGQAHGLGLYAEDADYFAPNLLSLYSTSHPLNQQQLNHYENQMGPSELQDTNANAPPIYRQMRSDPQVLRLVDTQNSDDINDILGAAPFTSVEDSDSFKNMKYDQYVHDFNMNLEMNGLQPQFFQNTDYTEAASDATVSPSPSQKSDHSPGSLGLGDLSRSRRTFNSFNVNFTDIEGSAGPAFSFADCSSEFHVMDYNYSFQDETAAVQKRVSITSLPKKKSTTKLAKQAAKPPLRKAKTSPNLGRPLLRKSLRVLKNMESGLLSFQIPPK